jgi:hypothetical protein
MPTGYNAPLPSPSARQDHTSMLAERKGGGSDYFERGDGQDVRGQ